MENNECRMMNDENKRSGKFGVGGKPQMNDE